MPMTQSELARAEPVYEELPGWWEDISAARKFDDLPAKARDYVLRLEELAGAQVSCIGVGPAASRPSCAATCCRSTRDRPTGGARPEYEHHGGFPRYEPAQPGPGSPSSSLPCGACRTWPCRRIRTVTPGTKPPSGPKSWLSCSTRSRLRKELPPRAGAVAARHGQPADAAVDDDEVRRRRCRNARPVQPLLRRRQHGGARWCDIAGVRLAVRHGGARRGRPISRTAYLKVDYRKVTPIDRPLVARGASLKPRAARHSSPGNSSTRTTPCWPRCMR
ncbi:adenylosuccinate synthetase family protein [Mycobacterium xenopi 4042]|uniref:Adenylosuccinate synthetase family protein n=1 Tax=Mycobacterium xenopi 4042 TaxID=1299334 RepID=X8DJR6_MYCXE|nr:adenylosuccinate synthetase family protein [Mycobacterium xenopi 4042]